MNTLIEPAVITMLSLLLASMHIQKGQHFFVGAWFIAAILWASILFNRWVSL